MASLGMTTKQTSVSGIAATSLLLLVRFDSDDLGGWDMQLVCQMKGCQFRFCLDNYLDQVSKIILGIHGGQLCTRICLFSRLC